MYVPLLSKSPLPPPPQKKDGILNPEYLIKFLIIALDTL